MSLISYINDIVKKAFEKNGYKIEGKCVKISDRPDLSQYQCNSALEKAKEYKANPREIATKVVATLENEEIIKEISIAGPGFINITLTDQFLAEYIQKIGEDINIGIEKKEPQKIFIDYGGPNVAKPLHVGHLRSAIIGEGLKRLAKELGHQVITDVHLGDWGRQMGMIISEIKRRNPDLVYFDENYTGEYPKESPVTVQELAEIYPTVNAKIKVDETALEEARVATAILQNEELNGHKGYYELWKQFVKVSIEDLKKTYKNLDVTFDLWKGESDANPHVSEVEELLRQKGLLQESEGALVVYVNEETDKTEIPPAIIRTRVGSVAYHTTDIVTIYDRVNEYQPDEIWYVADARQELHFTQVFRASKKSGIAPKNVKLEFIGFGTMNGKDGKPFKTRDGGVMPLSELIELVRKVCREKTDKNIFENTTEEQKQKIANIIADATIKYADSSSNRVTDYIFDIDKFTENQGKTGPYILYSTVRINSLIKKANEKNIKAGEILAPTEDYERKLMLLIAGLPEVLNSAYENKALPEIAEYLYNLNSAYNNFYTNCRILVDNVTEKEESWLKLSEIVGKINEKLLNIMVIQVPEKM